MENMGFMLYTSGLEAVQEKEASQGTLQAREVLLFRRAGNA
jgi:hypothetical protein